MLQAKLLNRAGCRDQGGAPTARRYCKQSVAPREALRDHTHPPALGFVLPPRNSKPASLFATIPNHPPCRKHHTSILRSVETFFLVPPFWLFSFQGSFIVFLPLGLFLQGRRNVVGTVPPRIWPACASLSLRLSPLLVPVQTAARWRIPKYLVCPSAELGRQPTPRTSPRGKQHNNSSPWPV